MDINDQFLATTQCMYWFQLFVGTCDLKFISFILFSSFILYITQCL